VELDLVGEAEAGESAPEKSSDDTAMDTGQIFLSAETGDESGLAAELSGSGSGPGTEGLNVLGETAEELGLGEDTSAETKAAGDEASLEEIEEDVNLDSFGSGSGLLDLSLQADDTSLGGILDEIYTAEGQTETAEGPALEMPEEAEERPLPEEPEFAEPEVVPAAPMAGAYAEAAPDTISSAFGIMLVLPLLALLYTAIVAIAGFNNVMPAILDKLQGLSGPGGVHIIWYVAGGLMLVAGLIVGGAFMLGGGSAGGKEKTKTKKAGKAKKGKKAADQAE